MQCTNDSSTTNTTLSVTNSDGTAVNIASDLTTDDLVSHDDSQVLSDVPTQPALDEETELPCGIGGVFTRTVVCQHCNEANLIPAGPVGLPSIDQSPSGCMYCGTPLPTLSLLG